MNFEPRKLFSESAETMKASEIRELLKLLNKPDMISFAGGLPNPEAFPIEGLRVITEHVMKDHPREALQYGPSEGHNKLREAIARGMSDRYGAPQNANSILITTGSQQGLHLISQIFINRGDIVMTENPTYLGALQIFRTYGAAIEGINLDEDGIDLARLEMRLADLARAAQKPKFFYAIPSFQNPTGITMSREKRKAFYALASKYDFMIVEDDPYGLLRYEGEYVPPLISLDHEMRVLYLGSFSKTLSPGFRVAWVCGPDAIIRKLVLAKQAADLCTNMFGQYCVFEAMAHNMFFPHVEKIRDLYRGKRDHMLKALEKEFPAGVNWTRPQGGLFLWITLPSNLDSLELLSKAIERNVAYVNGAPFFPNGGGCNTLRLNFSFAEDVQITEGIKRLGDVIRDEIETKSRELPSERVSIF